MYTIQAMMVEFTCIMKVDSLSFRIIFYIFIEIFGVQLYKINFNQYLSIEYIYIMYINQTKLIRTSDLEELPNMHLQNIKQDYFIAMDLMAKVDVFHLPMAMDN